MEGVTTAIVLFLFACVVYPRIVKNKPQYYAALAAVVFILLAAALAEGVGKDSSLRPLLGFVAAILQIGAILLLILACGGVSASELAGEMRGAFEVIRRGSEEKELIIPLTGEQPKGRIDDAAAPAAAAAPRPVRRTARPDSGSIPLD